VAIHLIYEDMGSSGYYSNVVFNGTVEVVEKAKLIDTEGLFMYLMIIALFAGIGKHVLDQHPMMGHMSGQLTITQSWSCHACLVLYVTSFQAWQVTFICGGSSIVSPASTAPFCQRVA